MTVSRRHGHQRAGRRLQGTLDLMVLRTLETMGPQHGLGLAKRILQVSEGTLDLNQGTLYRPLEDPCGEYHGPQSPR